MREVVGSVLGVVVLAAGACTAPEPDGGFDSEAAEDALVACASGFGVEVTSVEIAGPDDMSVQVAEDAPAEGIEKVQQECEPVASAAGGLDHEGDTEPQPVPGGVDDVDGYVETLRRDGFSGVLLVEQDGATSTSVALGLAATDPEVEMTTHTAFDIGSISKLFTAVAVLRLVDDGALSLDDTIGDLLGDVPADKQDITIRHLLGFSSGLREYHDVEGDFQRMTEDQARGTILEQDLLFEPGTDTAYSNSSYTLAAIVVSRVTGRDFTDVVADVFEDAELSNTGFYGSPVLQRIPVARGREGRTHEENDPARWTASWALLGSGGIVSSVGDLRRFWTQLEARALLGTDTTSFLFEEIVPSRSVDGVVFRGLSGANDFGFEVSIIEVPSDEVLVVVATNANPSERMLATDASLGLAQLATPQDG